MEDKRKVPNPASSPDEEVSQLPVSHLKPPPKSVRRNLIPCHEALLDISKKLDGDLARGRWPAVRLHLTNCRACSAYLQHLLFIRKLAGSLSKQPAEIFADPLSARTKRQMKRDLKKAKKKL
jgi:hypothetical protein